MIVCVFVCVCVRVGICCVLNMCMCVYVCVLDAICASEQKDGTTHQFLKVLVSLMHVVTAAAR